MDNHLPRIMTKLPVGGIENLMNRDWKPLVNAVFPPQLPDPACFPLTWIVAAPSSPEFLKSLGKPLTSMRKLESNPGIWWLESPDKTSSFVIFSDAHRKNSWKGGQICIDVSSDKTPFTASHPGLKALCQTFKEVYGLPPHPWDYSFDAVDWFNENSVGKRPVSLGVCSPRSSKTSKLK